MAKEYSTDLQRLFLEMMCSPIQNTEQKEI